MGPAWNTLIMYGLPDGTPRAKPRVIDFAAVRAALSAIDADALDEVSRVVLLAWLEAWRHHWRSRFERELGDLGERVLRALHGRRFDANRYVKLRRIAVENLASAL